MEVSGQLNATADLGGVEYIKNVAPAGNWTPVVKPVASRSSILTGVRRYEWEIA
jgi:hypothetical protein